MYITGRLVALAALGVLVAAVLPPVWLLAYALLLLLVMLLDLAAAARIADLRFERGPSASVRLGESTETTLTVTNRGRRALRGAVRDAWVPSAGARPRTARLAVPAGERRVLRTVLRPTRRGSRRSARVTVRALGPLGLAARQRSLPVPGLVRVLPAFTSRRFLPEKLARLRRIDGSVLMRRRGQGSEFDSLRTYVIGDDVRSIDWRATARSTDVMIRTWRPERDRQIVLGFDTGRTAAARLGDAPRLDAAMDAALLVAAVAARAGDRVALVAADVAVRARLGATSGSEVLPRLVDVLTDLEPALVETDPQLLAAEIGRQVHRRSLVVLFGSLDTAPDTGLIPAARSLVARHVVIVASPSDPTLAELTRGREDVSDVYLAAAAELAAAGRRQVIDELRRMGATVVDASADRFASAVADAYLDLKAAGRL